MKHIPIRIFGVVLCVLIVAAYAIMAIRDPAQFDGLVGTSLFWLINVTPFAIYSYTIARSSSLRAVYICITAVIFCAGWLAQFEFYGAWEYGFGFSPIVVWPICGFTYLLVGLATWTPNLTVESDARETLSLLSRIDEALVGIGTCAVDAPLRPGENFFSLKQFARAQKLGAVGQVNLRFIDADGNAVPSELDELVIGVSREQLLACSRTIAVAGGQGL